MTKLVIHPIAMLRFKDLVHIPIRLKVLFAKKITSFIIIIPGRVDHFTPHCGGVKLSTNHPHFMESIFRIIYQNILVYPLK